ncbi:MAG: DUF423 domain-containing protein [Rhizobiaceae bacterium]|nr:DUF423 domain-containing protein [Rhizobiaceae bacterium]
MILALGAALGFISVAFGAFAEHALRETVTDEHFRYLMTAVRYNQVHAVMAAAIGLALLTGQHSAYFGVLRWSGVLFIIGTMLFSFSIYLSVSFDIPTLVYLTPVGGMTIMVAWFCLLVAGVFAAKKATRH